MSIIERVRASGGCPPSLIGVDADTDFETAALKVVDANGLYLSFETTVPADFKTLLQLTTSNTGDNAVLISRRSVVLSLVASTPLENTMLDIVLRNGYLSTVKLWMDDILKGTLGGVDLLLHLLSKIALLPVTKSIVKESGMGKVIGSIEKHRICADSPNKGAIVERVSDLKAAWHKSVKLRKDSAQSSTATSDKASSAKRGLESAPQTGSPIAKKAKVEETKKSVFSSLLKKVDPKASIVNTSGRMSTSANGDAAKKAGVVKKTGKRLKWKDHFGGKLEAAKVISDDNHLLVEDTDEASGSLADRRSRDRLREKELIAKAKKKKLLDDDDDDLGSELKMPPTVQPTIAWHTPPLLPVQDPPPPPNNSTEKIAQTTRMASVVQASYFSEQYIPMNPAPLSDVEQALDMTSHSSIATQAIPFFVPQTPVAPAPAPAATPAYPPPPPPTPAGVASADMVQNLGLPSFLAGQNLQALQTLASTPKLLGSFVDSNGMYNQMGLMNLVQTLSQNSPTNGQQSQGASTGFQQPPMGQNAGATGTYGQPPGGMYGASSGMDKYGGGQQGAYGKQNNWQQGNAAGGMPAGGSYRGAQNSSEGNLHLSGYGPGTTQSEIIQLFSPYVQVSEVVMKATFSFVNTNDPMGAKQAREALNGALLGGTPVRINMAQRKNRDANPGMMGASQGGSHYGQNRGMGQPNGGGFSGGFGQPRGVPPPPMGMPPGQAGGDPSQVRDDRGNPATKNLFVAGYGQGTSEHQLREIFGVHAQITGIISKGTFSFVNTTDKSAAIRARELLSGTMVNGGVLRINFAKETGRLGTSFDLTYGGGGGGGGGQPPQQQQRSHYGRY